MDSPSPRIMAVVNQKGGVGKTTTAINVSACLALAGHRTLLVDCDPQGNATSGLGVDKTGLDRCIYDVLIGEAALRDVILPNTVLTGLDLLPSTLNLAGAETQLYSAPSREAVLKHALRPIAEDYQYVLIDAPPSLGLLTLNVLAAADSLLIPIQCEYYALEGISQLLNVVEQVQQEINPRLKIALIILTMHDERVNLSRQVVKDVREHFGDQVAKTVVPRNVRLSEAPSYGRPISSYDPKSRGAQAYAQLTQEVMALESI